MLAALKFCFAALILLVNTLLFCGLMLPFALLKLLLLIVQRLRLN